MNTKTQILRAKKILEKNKSYLATNFMIENLGIGYKIKDGKITDDVALIANVYTKYTEEYLIRNKIKNLPKIIDGIQIDIIESRISLRNL